MIHSKRLPLAAATMLSLLTASQVNAAGFAIIEHSASGMGSAFAGASALADDASIAWFNPAGLTRLGKPQLVVAGHVITSKAKFTDKGSNVNPALTSGVVPGSLTGSNDDGGTLGLVPNFYYSRPFRDDLTFGLAINAPFGLATEYDDQWVGRYHGIDSEVMTLNINPSLGWRVNDAVSVGGGISIQYVKAILTSAIDSAALCLKLANGDPAKIADCGANGLGVPSNAATDSKAELDSDNWDVGFNLGVLFNLSDRTRIGVSYRSEIEHATKGNADFTVDAKLQPFIDGYNAAVAPLGKALLKDTGIRATVSLPATFSISGVHELNDQITLLADVTWTGWSSFKELRIHYDSGQADSVTDENWNDVLRYAIGLNYKMDDKLVLRTGLAFDEEAIPDPQHRTPRIPGNDRSWITLGAGYQWHPNARVDVGYAHLFVDDTPMDHTDDNGYSLRGVYEASVDIFSAQLTWNF